MAAHAAQPVRLGIIGCGTIAFWAHLRSLQHMQGAALVAAADPDPAARSRAARLLRGPIHEEASSLLQSEVDAVIISVPNALHAGLTIAAVRAGKHVYVEKPLATCAADARAVVEDVARSNVVGAVGFNYRHHPAHQKARALLKREAIGRIRAVQTAFCEPVALDMMPHWKRRRESGGGALLDLASHHIDLLRWFLDDEVAGVEARIGSIRTEQDSAMLALSMRSGVDVQTYVSFLAGPADFLEFIGERGAIRVDRHALAPIVKHTRVSGYGVRSAWTPPSFERTALWARRLAQPSHQPSFRRALAAFVRRIGGESTSLATIEDGEKSLAVVLAAEESACRRGGVTVS